MSELEAGAKIKNFTDLNVWRAGHMLVLDVYRKTKGFPREEQFGITSQIRRAVISVTSNIAEGFSRATKADKSHFYTMAYGSLTELQNQLLIARDVQYLKNSEFDELANQSVTVQKLLSGLIRSVKQGKGVQA